MISFPPAGVSSWSDFRGPVGVVCRDSTPLKLTSYYSIPWLISNSQYKFRYGNSQARIMDSGVVSDGIKQCIDTIISAGNE